MVLDASLLTLLFIPPLFTSYPRYYPFHYTLSSFPIEKSLCRCHASPPLLYARTDISCHCGFYSKLRARKISNAVVAVGFACFGMNLVGVDADGHPCTPVFTYANSSRGNSDITNRLRESLERAGHAGTHGLEEARQRTGTPIHVSYAPVQLLQWLTRTSDESKSRAKVKTWMTLPSLIAARWCCLSSAPVSYSEASWMGLLDFRRLEVKREDARSDVPGSTRLKFPIHFEQWFVVVSRAEHALFLSRTAQLSSVLPF